MHRLIRLYNQNREFVIAISIIVALILIVIYTLNSIIAKDQERKLNEMSNLVNSSINDKTAIHQNDKSAITGEKVENNESNIQTIKQFIKCCNEGEYELAYSMLSEECKQELYPSLERFKSVYIDRIFTIKRLYTLENWYSSRDYDTYFVRYSEDVLATGNVNSSDNMSDYITVDRSKNKNYLNISEFVGYEDIGKSKTLNGVTITINKLYMYMDYTILDITVVNSTGSTISIDTKEKKQTMYLYDGRSIKYEALLNENGEKTLQVISKAKNNIRIKFSKMYNPDSRIIAGIKFEDIVLNYENYIGGTEEKNNIEIDINI